MTRVLCTVPNCVYMEIKKEEKGVCRFQCANDEIDISLSEDGRPVCFSYEENEEKRR